MRRLWKSILCISILLVGCSKSPMDELQSNTQNSNLSENFWSLQRQQKTILWGQAKLYCQQNISKPNCAPVISQIFLDGSTIVPKYGSSRQTLTVPNL